MYTIVVADDEEELRRAIIRKIDWESIGFRVVGEAENGIEALELVERMEPDLLLTDIRMPFVSGIELARQVREVRPTTQIAFLSGFDEFSYAQQAIQYNIISYMLKPITMTDLTEELKKIKAKIDGIFAEFDARNHENPNLQQFFLPLLLDDYVNFDSEEREELLIEQAIQNGFLKDRNNSFQYAVIAFTVEDEEGRNQTRPELVHSVDMILQKYIKHYSFAMDGRIITVLAATTATFDRYLHIAVGEMVQSTERILKKHCHIGVSRIRERLGECHEAYRGAMSALGYCKQGESSIHYIADEERDNSMDMEQASEYVAQMENLIRGGSREELETYLKDIFEKTETEQDAQLKCKFIIFRMSSALIRIAYTVTDDTALLQRCAMLEGPVRESKERFMALCLEVWELVNAGKKKSSQILCEKAMQIIERDYGDQSLSLVGVSNSIHVSPNYLSALIKKETGASFVDLLTKKRIETARELVLGSSMKMREIAERCGYGDQHYFSYCFKKYCGISPNAMRQEKE